MKRAPQFARLLVLTSTALVAAAVLYIALDLNRVNLEAPLNFSGDSLYFLSLAKNICEGELPWLNPRLGAPFQADWRDFPSYQWIDFLGIRVLSFFISGAPLTFNLYWLLTVVAAAVSATACLLRLGLNSFLAVGLGLVYAFQPFTFVRNISHFNLVHYLVPPLALMCIEIVSAESVKGPLHQANWLRRNVFASLRGVPVYAWIVAVLQGLSYVYNSFFACILLAIGGSVTMFRRRSIQPLVQSGALVLVIGGATAAGLSPTLLYWFQHGKNPATQYKAPVEADIYGLKIRNLVTPVPHTPVPLLRRAAHGIQAAFASTDQHENAYSRLGTFASLSFVALLAYGLLRMAGYRTAADGGELSACSVLLFSCTLLATVGGFGSVFNTVVAPDIRAYNRIVVFIHFLCIAGAGIWLQHVLVTRLRLAGWAFALVVCSLAAFAIRDELWVKDFFGAGIPPSYESQRAFVKEVESVVGDGPVFQLPYATFPVDNRPGGLADYEHARAYICSDRIRWSWGGITGRRSSEWGIRVSRLPVRSMISELTAAGFKAIWVDSLGYKDKTVIRRLGEVIQTNPLISPDGRFLVFRLPPLGEALQTGVEPEEQPLANGFRENWFSPPASGRQNGLLCHVDRINEGAPGRAVLQLKKSQRLALLGWAADPSNSTSPASVIIGLMSDGKLRYAAVANRSERPDVAAAFSRPELTAAGFVLDAGLEAVASGTYSITVFQVAPGHAGACETGVRISVK